MTRVNIQYSIELDDIPKELDRMLKSEQITLGMAKAVMENLSFNCDLKTGVDGIDTIRRLLFEIDERLSDMNEILKGYHVQQASLSAEQHTASTPQNQPSPPAMQQAAGQARMMPASEETMRTIQAELSAHKNELASLENTLRNPATYGEFGTGMSQPLSEAEVE